MCLCCVCVASRLVLQLICFTATVTATNSTSAVTYWPNDMPAVTWVVALVWPVVLVGLYELVKRREIKYEIYIYMSLFSVAVSRLLHAIVIIFTKKFCCLSNH